MTNSPPPTEASAPGDDHSSGTEPDYAVGYGRPPLHTRFKPGQSGNRRGRPKRQRNVRTVVEETLNQRIKIRDGNGSRSVSKLDGVVLTVINGALRGDPKALTAFITLLRSLGMTNEAPIADSTDEPLAPNHEAIIEAYLYRQYDKVVERDRVFAPPELLDDDPEHTSE